MMRLFNGYIDRRPLMERDGSGASTLLGLDGFVVRAQLLEEASGEWWYFDERAELRQLDTLRPVVDRLLVRPAGRCEAGPQRVDLGLRDVDRERPDRCGARRLLRRRNGHGGLLVVACRGPEELEHGGVLERGGVRHVDDDRCALEDVVQSVATERVDARAGAPRGCLLH